MNTNPHPRIPNSAAEGESWVLVRAWRRRSGASRKCAAKLELGNESVSTNPEPRALNPEPFVIPEPRTLNPEPPRPHRTPTRDYRQGRRHSMTASHQILLLATVLGALGLWAAVAAGRGPRPHDRRGAGAGRTGAFGFADSGVGLLGGRRGVPYPGWRDADLGSRGHDLPQPGLLRDLVWSDVAGHGRAVPLYRRAVSGPWPPSWSTRARSWSPSCSC